MMLASVSPTPMAPAKAIVENSWRYRNRKGAGRLSLTERKGLVAFDSFPSCSFSLSAPLKRHFLPHASFQGLTVFTSFVETNRRWGPQQLMTLLESSFSVCLTSVSESE